MNDLEPISEHTPTDSQFPSLESFTSLQSYKQVQTNSSLSALNLTLEAGCSKYAIKYEKHRNGIFLSSFCSY